MNWWKKLFGGTPVPQESRTKTQTPSTARRGNLLSEFDSFNEVQDLGGFLKKHSEEEIMSFIDTFPFGELKLDYASLQKDFRNSRRFEMVLYLASILLKWSDYRSDPRWQGLLPPTLNASAVYQRLRSGLATFLETQKGRDIAMVLRTRLYDFAMDLICLDKNRDALLCLEVSRPSPREDHDFWLCACCHNIGKLEKDPAVIRRGVEIAEELTSGKAKTPSNVLQKLRQTNLLENLRKMQRESAKAQEDPKN